MKVIVAGSRTIDDRDEIRIAIEVAGLFNKPAARSSPSVKANEDGDLCFGPVDEIVHGGAMGVDQIAANIAARKGFDVIEFEPDWDEHGKAAGPIRNREMAQYADALVAIWDGESSGTKSMIDIALDEGLDTYVVQNDS